MPTPYAGNAANYPNAVDVLSGGDVPSTTAFNTPYEGTLDRTAYIVASLAQDWRSQFSAATVQGPSATPTLGTILAAAFDPIERVWLLGGADGSGVDALFKSVGIDDGGRGLPSTDVGAAWTLVGSTSISIIEQMALLADESVGGRYWTAIAPNGGGVAVHSWLGGSSTSQHSFAPSGTLFPEMLFFNSRVICAIGSSTSASVSINSAAASAPGTWTQNLLPAVSVKTWALKTDKVWPGAGTIAIAMPMFSANTATPNYWTSTDGSTWTARSFSTTVLAGATDVVIGLTWSPIWETWYCTVNVGAGTSLQVFTSPDGITWAAVAMVTTIYSDTQILDIAPLGSTLIATTVDNSTSGERFLMSPDGGATWYQIAANFSTSFASGGSQYIRGRLTMGSNGLFAINNEWGRFSRFLGLPGVAQ